VNKTLTFCVICVLCGSVVFAQNYRCDWNVVGLGGGDMISASYRAGTTVGQTAIGQITGTIYQAFIGFWQIDTASTGIKDEAHWNAVEPLVTMLYATAPNPAPVGMLPLIRYSLAAEGPVMIQLFDLTGRTVQTLVSSNQAAGRYSLRPTGAAIPRGVHFLKMRTTEYQATRKLVVR
jgi:hypothetical protein